MSSVHNFGAAGDGRTDDTAAIQHAVDDGEGLVEFPRGDYRITKTIVLDTAKVGRLGVHGSLGTAKVIMAGAGPAFRLVGNHAGSADPATMKPDIWRSQRMPTLANLEIEGGHAEADGIELVGTVQAIVRGVGMHALRHGVSLLERNRNTIIEGCHIYHNRGIGVRLDGVNLHQINILGNHISYNRLGGIRIERSEVRNLQITGNDIEYNNNRAHNIADEPTAEIFIDTTAPNATVCEVTIASNTIQATASPGGANLRIIEDGQAEGRPPDLYAITGNVIGSQETNVHLSGCYGVTLTGNNIYSAGRYNLHLENCRQMVVSSNQFRRHTPEFVTGVLVDNCRESVLSACHVLDEVPTGQKSGLPLLELRRSERLTVTGWQLVAEGVPCLVVEECRDTLVSGCSLFGGKERSAGKPVLRWTGPGGGNQLLGCRIQPGMGEGDIAREAQVRQEANVVG